MLFLKRLLSCLLLMALFNRVLIGGLFSVPAQPFLDIALVLFFIAYNIAPRRDRKSQNPRLTLLLGGYELTLMAMACFTLEVLGYLGILVSGTAIAQPFLILNALVCAALLFLLLLNGMIRIFSCSKQLGLLPRLMLLFLWWLPVVNLLLLRNFLHTSRDEYVFTAEKAVRNRDRKHERLCETKYPLLMVHGVFFRDWKNFNYWGRIPDELIANGATVFYGSHQSSASVEQCAEELRGCIQAIVRETGCEKVNIIAHSKGGLDARYAISCLGMDAHVASLTTINTPHHGCNYVRQILKALPHGAVAALGRKYESVYTHLGDESPDFFRGLSALTDQECARLNQLMPDANGVLYQSVGSRMRSRASAVFPLSLGYTTIKLLEGGDNDGLVNTQSMAWGNFLGVVNPKGKQGISHGDMIDLTRKNIAGFDVGEFYVDLVNRLKQQGY